MDQIASAHLPVGTKLEEYEMTEILGQGGFGITYKAWDNTLNCQVAIKEYFPRQLAGRDTDSVSIRPLAPKDADAYQRGLKSFVEEARVLAQFQHSGIVPVKRLVQANATAYMVMGFVEGEALDSYLDQHSGSVAPDILVKWTEQLLDALGQVHDAGLLHRDIKPGNIYIDKSGNQAILLDFGASRRVVAEASQSITGIVSAGYTSPEQYSESTRNQGAWSDIYSLSATLYRCITGQKPVEAPLRRDEIDAGEPDPVAPLSSVTLPQFPAGLIRAVTAGLILRRKDRLQSVAEFRSVMEGTRPTQPKPAHLLPGDSPSPTVPQSADKRYWPQAVLAMIIIALIGVGAWYFLMKQTAQTEAETQAQAAKEAAQPEAETQAQAVEEVAQPEAETQAQAAEEVAQPEAETQAQAAEEVAQPEAETQAQAVEEVAQPEAKTQAQAVEEVAQPEAKTQAQAAEEVAQPEAETQAQAAEEAAQQKAETIAKLLEMAHADIAALRLLAPVGNNAYEKLQKVLLAHPGHPEAAVLINEILSVYARQLKKAADTRAFDKAEQYLNRMRQINPDAPEVAVSEQLIAQERRKAKIEAEAKAKAEAEAKAQRQVEAEAEERRQAETNKALIYAARYGETYKVQRLLSLGVDVDQRWLAEEFEGVTGWKGVTALMMASRYNHVAIVEALLKAGADIQAQDADGYTSLHHAVSGKPTLAVIKTLLNANAEPDAKTDKGYTPLHYAAGRASPAVIKALLDAGADVQVKDKEHDATPLHYAANYTDTPAVIKLLLDAGADIQSKSGTGITPLHSAASSNANITIITALLNAGADIQATDNDLSTPLHHAASSNADPKIIETLIDAGADIQAVGRADVTPLHYAAWQTANAAVIEALLNAGADIRAQLHDGRTPWDMANENDKIKGTAIHQRLMPNEESPRTKPAPSPMINKTQSPQANDDKATGAGKALLHAAFNGDEAEVRRLLSFGEDVNQRWLEEKFSGTPGRKGATALMLAGYAGHAGIIQTLLKFGADIKSKDKNGLNALHYAASGATSLAIQTIETLLKAGADIQAKNRYGDTPLHVAAMHAHTPAVISTLLDAGANIQVKNKDGNTPWNLANNNDQVRDTPVHRRLKP